jgi:hypothetical protein
MAMLFLILLIALSPANSVPNIGIKFNWTKGGSYSAYGTDNYLTKFTYPFDSATNILNGSIFVDLERHVIAIKAPGHADQYVTDNGFYIIISLNGQKQCFVNNDFNYSRYIDSYTEALNNEVQTKCSSGKPKCDAYRFYSGLIRDPGACNHYASVSIKTEMKLKGSNKYERIKSYTIHQPFFFANFSTVTKYYGDLLVDHTVNGVDEADVTLPAQCDSPGPYCQYLYPPGFDYTLYK